MVFFLWHIDPSFEKKIRLFSIGIVSLFWGFLPETAVHAISGMETATYTFLFTGFVVLSCLSITFQESLSKFLPLMALLCGLMRPESNLVSILFLGIVIFQNGVNKRLIRNTLLYYFLPGLLYL